MSHQVDAFREGLGVFVDDSLRSTLRQCCTVAEIQVRSGMCALA
jgi:hypothetical protein